MRSVAIFTRERWLLAIHSPQGEQRRDKASQVPLTRVGPGRSKRTGDAKGVCSPSPPFVTSPLPLSLSPPFPRVKKRRQTSQLQRWTRVIPAIGLHLHINRCKAAVIGEKERERERRGSRFPDRVDERPMSDCGHNLFNDCYDYDRSRNETTRPARLRNAARNVRSIKLRNVSPIIRPIITNRNRTREREREMFGRDPRISRLGTAVNVWPGAVGLYEIPD